MSTTGGVGMTQANSLDGIGVDTGLLRQMWQTRIHVESLLPEPFFNNENLIQTVDLGGKKPVMPGSLFLDISLNADKGVRKVTIPFLRSIADDAVEGNGSDYLGEETNLRMKYATFYANDYGRPVASQEYGIDFREIEAYKVYEMISPLLWQWLGEYRGFCMRHAICENISHNLTTAPTSLTAGMNANIWFPALTETQQPAFVTSATEYTEAVGDACTEAGGQYNNNQLNVAAILDVLDYFQRKYLKPVEVAGKKVYFLTISPKQALRLKKPSVTDSLAKYWNDSGADIQGIKELIPDVEGMVDNVVLVKDMRAPTLLKGGSNSSWTETFGYVRMGRTDGRTATTGASAFDVNLFLGENSGAKMETEMPHFEQQYDNYDKFRGDLLAGACSYQTVRFDIDTASDSDKMQQESCGLVLTNRV